MQAPGHRRRRTWTVLPVLPGLIALMLLGAAFTPAAVSDDGPQLLSVLSRSDSIEVPFAEGTAPLWVGQTHAHSTGSHDGFVAPEELAALYAELGYHFLIITDHDVVTTLPSAAPLLLVGGEEISRSVCTPQEGCRGPHIVNVGLPTHVAWEGRGNAGVLAEIDRRGGQAIIAHPNWKGCSAALPAWTLEELLMLEGYHGVEVYTHIVGTRLCGSPWALDVWLGLLAAGRNVAPVAVDDAHQGPEEMGFGAIAVPAAKLRGAAVRDALEHGRSIALVTRTPGSFELLPSAIVARDRTLTVSFAGPVETIAFLDVTGTLRQVSSSPKAVYVTAGDENAVIVLACSGENDVTVLPAFRVAPTEVPIGTRRASALAADPAETCLAPLLGAGLST